ncbi:MAG: hypothetical protein ACFFDW_08405 [Candidatus Thorarchaeota archaeon]
MKLITKEVCRIIVFISLFTIFSSLLLTQTTAQSKDKTIIEPNITNQPPIINDVTHSPINPDNGQTIYISAYIYDPDGLLTVALYFREIGVVSWNSTALSQVESSNYYAATIGPYSAGFEVEYYIYAQDDSSSHYTTIEDNGGLNYNFTVLEADYIPPVITNVQHTPEIPTDNDLIEISCTVTDSSAVIVLLNFRVNGSAWANQTMINTEGDTYTTTVGEFNIDTLFEYRIYAIDQSFYNNTALENAGGENYYFTVVINDTVAPVIIDIMLDPGTVLEGQTVIITCTVADDYNDVLNVTLYYRVNGGTWLQASFVHGEGYSVTIGPFVMDDLVEFYIEAFDDSPNANSRINDNEGSYFSFTVLEGTEGTSLYALIPIAALLAMGVITRRKK